TATWVRGIPPLTRQQRALVTAMSAIDIAVWDLMGKAIGRPVHALLGGALRERVPAYVTGFYYPGGGASGRPGARGGDVHGQGLSDLEGEGGGSYTGGGFRARAADSRGGGHGRRAHARCQRGMGPPDGQASGAALRAPRHF